MKTINILKSFAVLTYVMFSFMTFVSCSDEPEADSYYTSTAEYAGDFLKNREKFSSFTRVVERANMMNLLNTYGEYTVFAPTNDAFSVYLASRGLSSVEEIPEADCDTLVYTHVIENAALFTTDGVDGQLPNNMLDQVLTLTAKPILAEDGSILDSDLRINQEARMIAYDDSVENGVVHTMDAVIGAKNNLLPSLIAADPNLSIFNEAFLATKLIYADGVNLNGPYEDENYLKAQSPSFLKDSVSWTNLALVMHTADEYDNVAYPKKRYYKYTAFIETNDVYEAEFATRGYDPELPALEKMRKLAAEIYDEMYPEDVIYYDDLDDRRNSLNRFISYHFLDRYGSYYSLTPVDKAGSELAKNWNRSKWDIADWYETLMPHSIMKLSFPSGAQGGLYINRRGVQSNPDARGVQIRGSKITPPYNMTVDPIAVNGIYHYIDAIIHYGKETQTEVLNERIRLDASTLSPDFMNAEARGVRTRYSNHDGGMYGGQDKTYAITNKQTCYGFKSGFVKNFEFNDKETHIHVRPRVLSFWSYQGDEVTVKGQYDFTVKLPPLPEGNYELRLLTCMGFESRGIVQVYFDGVPCGIPFDMRPNGSDPMIGWKSDTSLGDEVAIAADDKAFHNRGWMKGPASYRSGSSETNGGGGTLFRDNDRTNRKVITRFTHDGKTDHYVRFQQKMISTENEMNFDFIELCPSSVYNDTNYPEDKW